MLRLLPLNRYVTPDEPAWIYRAIRFADGLAARDWAAIPTTGHPGVTTMWLGSAGVLMRHLLDPAGSDAHLEWIRHLAWLAPENAEAFRHLASFLPWGRVVVALVTTAGLLILYPLLVRLLDRRVALLTVGLLAFDPFLIGHSGLLHTDALLTTFSLLALVTGLCGLREPRRAIWWALSGLFTGLALLTKTPALILLPFILLLIIISNLQYPISHTQYLIPNTQHPTHNLPLFIVHCSLFILSTAIIYFALYPILWANPTDTLSTLFAFAGRHVETVQRPIFFAGRMIYDPGPIFYPIVFLFRISPVVLVGLIVSLVALRRLPANRRLTLLLLLAFAVGFGALMSLGAKKHDRYLLPAFPPLTLAAALGWECLSKWAHKHQASSTLTPFAHLLLPLLQLILLLPFAPYPLTAFNPLVGGPWGAARVLSLGWGEGTGAAARWLNRLPNADQLTVAAASIPSFAPLFDGRTLPLDQATLADYTVRVLNGPGTIDNKKTSDEQPPSQLAHTIRLGFVNHAAILTNTVPFEQAAYLAVHAGPDDLILLNADTPLLRHYSGPGTLASAAGLPDPAAIAARLAELDSDRPTLWLVADPAASPITAAHLAQVLEAIATPATTATVAATTVTQFPNTQYPIPNIEYPISTFSDQLTLITAVLPADPVNTPFRIFLRWQAPAPTPTDLHASLYLQDSAGHAWAEVGQLALNEVHFPTSAWAPDEWADNVVTLKLPAGIPPDTYTVQLTVTDGEGAQLGAWDAKGQFQGVRVPLGEAKVAPPAEPWGKALCEPGRVLTVGPFETCIHETIPQAVPSGDVSTLAMIWFATAPPEAAYRVRWRLLDAADAVALEEIVPLSPYPTSRWRAGDRFESRYDLWFDPILPATRYTLAFNVLTPNDRPLWAEDESLATVEVLPRDRLFELPTTIGHPLDLTLGDTVHLRGFDLWSPPPLHLRPGDTLPLSLYWQADGPTDLDYTVFVHLVGPDGRPHGQVDYFPAGGAAPTTSWAPGQVIVDEIVLPVDDDAPAGAYHIAVGMYDAGSGGRLPISDASGQAHPGDQAILPVEITVSGDQP